MIVVLMVLRILAASRAPAKCKMSCTNLKEPPIEHVFSLISFHKNESDFICSREKKWMRAQTHTYEWPPF